MAFSVPTFNLKCNVYDGPWVSKVLRIADLECNLALGRRVQQLEQDFFGFGRGAASPCLLVPAGSDVRDLSQNIAHPDLIEVPSGSGRWYTVNLVDDVGKGFDNEYRIVAMAKISQSYDTSAYPGLAWPIPMP